MREQKDNIIISTPPSLLVSIVSPCSLGWLFDAGVGVGGGGDLLVTGSKLNRYGTVDAS